MTAGLLVEWTSEHVVVVTIDRPPSNYFDAEIIAAIAGACEDAAAGGARAAVLHSTGRVFCAGADFAATDDDQLDPETLYRAGLRLWERTIPMVAAIQGAAVGGGAGLALAADMRVASENARFAVNFSQLGIHHGFGLTVTLPRVVGQQVALDLLLTGRRIDGAEAYRVGLVDRLVSADQDVRAVAVTLAAQVAANAPLAVQAIRTTMLARLREDVQAAVIKEAHEQRLLFATKDFREGVAAVSERRPGRFVGR
jgi:2-(1,2-epoxy-1,2-dihydrophenyl)acetyl-CoA isomerase